MVSLSDILKHIKIEYSFYIIYGISLENTELYSKIVDGVYFKQITYLDELNSQYPAISSTKKYFGDEAYCFGAIIDHDLVSVCWFWTGERYKSRNFWPLKQKEAKLIQINTAEGYQRRGIAQALIAYSLCEMKKRGFEKLFARIWHSNKASLKVFQDVRWKRVAYIIEIILGIIKKIVRIEYDCVKPTGFANLKQFHVTVVDLSPQN